jgi:hypothetical protein
MQKRFAAFADEPSDGHPSRLGWQVLSPDNFFRAEDVQ